MRKCFGCKLELNQEDAEKVNVSRTEKISYRYFHSDCKETFFAKRFDNDYWNELYDYVKYEILQYTKDQSLSKHLIRRLKGMRSGQYIARKGSSSLSENGYPYQVILMTFKIKKVDILNAISNKSKFQSEKNKEDYMMAIIQNSINDVYLRMKEKKESDERVEKIELNDNVEVEFKNKSKINENKVANKLKHLW